MTGDIHLSHGATYVLTKDEWQDLLGRWRDAGSLFGVIVGDLGYGEGQDVDDVVSGWAAVPGAPRILYAWGNHERDSPAGKREWIDRLYPGAVQPSSWSPTVSRPGTSDRAYWSFNVGPYWHFAMLDADMIRANDDSDVSDTVGTEQLRWLAADLEANRDSNIMVFVHEPIDQARFDTPFYTLNDRGPLMELLAGHPKQTFVFSGHLHGYRGITKWKGITSVHTSDAAPTGTNGVTVSINGETATVSWPGMTAADIVDYDRAPMYVVETLGGSSALPVAEDGMDVGQTRTQPMQVVGPQSGVTPTLGSLMLSAGPITWYDSWFISEQLVKILPGMKFSYDIQLLNVVDGLDAVGVQPNWVMMDGSQPPVIADQNGIALSTRPRDGGFNLYYDDLPGLGGRATGQWYHREIDLTPLAGNYADGVVLGARFLAAQIGTVYVDNIRFTWPTTPCTGTLAPASQVFAAAGGTGTVTVTAATGCAWMAASSASWITIASGTSAMDSGNVSYAVQSNTTSTPRSGTLTIAGRTFTVSQNAQVPLVTATLTYPVSGASNVDLSLPLLWTSVPNVQAYYLYVGTTVGAKDLVNTGEMLQTTYRATLPGGQLVYARLWAKVGGVWRYTDSSFTPAVVTATLTYPVTGASNVDLSLPLQWTSVPNVQVYYLYVGTTVGAKNLVNTGEMLQTAYRATLPGGQLVYARLWTKVNGVWRYTDSSFTPR